MKWSYSQHAAMRRCQRAFIFGHVMASHNARDPQRREAFILKQLQHVSAWQGSLVHEVLATDFLAMLRMRRPVDPALLTASAQELARRQLAFSAAQRYREPGQTKKEAGSAYAALFEHEHGRDIPPDALAAVDVTLARCFQNLAAQDDFIAYLRAGFGHAAEATLNFRLNDTTVAATPDLVFFHTVGRPVVVDWKVAKSETSDYSWQLLAYALAMARCGRWPGVSAEDVELYEVNLLKSHIQRHPVSAQRLEAAEDFIYRSTVELAALVGGQKFDQLDLDEFEVAERPGTCLHCTFKDLCMQQFVAAGRSTGMDTVQGRLL